MELEVLEPQDKKYTGCLIFLHGAKRSGKWQKEMFLDLIGDDAYLRDIKVLFPTSPVGYSEQFNMVTNTWFDRLENGQPISMSSLTSKLDKVSESLKGIISNEERLGIPLNRIIIGGISQGGVLAIHTAFCYYPELAGCVAVSAYVPHKNIYQVIKQRTRNPPLFMFHGTEDASIPLELARESHREMLDIGVSAELQEFAGAPHELVAEELRCIYDRVKYLLP